METPVSIANYFVNKSLSGGENLTPMKLLKLVYLAHGWNLGLTNEPLLSEAIQAWKFGPVVRSVYDSFKQYKDCQIDAMSFDMQTMGFSLPKEESKTKLLDKIWDVYKGYSGLELSTLTHESGSPWDIVWNKEGGKDKISAIIRNDLIAEYYRNKANVKPVSNV